MSSSTAQRFPNPPITNYLLPSSIVYASSFQPTQIPNCILWLDGADIGTLFTDSVGSTPVRNSGDTVSYWKDKSSSGNNATNTVSQPTVTFSAQNNKSVINFNGAQYLNLTPSKLPNGSTPFSFFILLKTSKLTVYLSWGTTLDSGGFGKAIQFYVNGSFQLVNDTYGGVSVSNTTVFNNVFVLNSVTADTKYNGWANGSAFTTQNTNVTLNTGTSFAYIGVGQVNNVLTTSYYLNGQITEIIGYNRVITTLERQQIESYLMNKWGLNTSLSSQNPFSATTPFLMLPPVPNVILPNLGKNVKWIPTNISGINLWLDAADSTYVTTTGSTVTQWKDKSGQNNNTSSANGSPQYNSSQLNKLAGITFNGSSTYFVVPRVATDDWSIFIVLTTTQLNSGAGGQWWAGNGIFDAEIGGTTTDFGISLYGSGFATGVGNPPTGDNTIISSTSINTGAGFICEFQRISSSGFFENFVNGNSQGSTTGGTGSRTTSRITIGVIQTLVNYFNGVIYEIIVYPSYLSLLNRQQVEGYLAWKWGLVSQLPVSHPYKLFPPPPR